MTQNTIYEPVATDDFTGFRAWFINWCQNIITNSTAAARPENTELYEGMWFVDSDDSVVDLYHGSTWYTVLQAEANGGMVRHDGSQVMTGDLDLDGNDIILTADQTIKIINDTSAELGIEISGTERVRVDATYLNLKPAAGAAMKIKDPLYNTTASLGAQVGQILIEVNGNERALGYYATS